MDKLESKRRDWCAKSNDWLIKKRDVSLEEICELVKQGHQINDEGEEIITEYITRWKSRKAKKD
jgi:hypothetical protein